MKARWCLWTNKEIVVRRDKRELVEKEVFMILVCRTVREYAPGVLWRCPIQCLLAVFV